MIVIILEWFKYKMMVCGITYIRFWIGHNHDIFLAFLVSLNRIKLGQLDLFWK